VFGSTKWEFLFLIGFVASVASITADKFASEVGMLDGMPRMLLGFKKVKKGTSGAVTWLGLVASAVAAFIISLSMILISPHIYPAGASFTIVISVIVASGFVGNIVDSLAGYYEERGIGDKYTSNALCSIAGGIISIIIMMLILHYPI
jgi:uncharacterized protein (TIGR00297 family)